jgi:hypothetical protein
VSPAIARVASRIVIRSPAMIPWTVRFVATIA